MYDDEEEIRRKRRNLIIIVCIIVCIIIFLVIFLFVYKPPEPEVKISCTLEAEREPDANGVYTSPVKITINGKPSSGAAIVNKNVGIRENEQSNLDTFTVSTEGKTNLIGFVQDSNNNTATCTMTVNYNSTKTGCALEVVEGTPGENGWFVSDVKIGFKAKTGNIIAFGIGTSENYDGNESFVVTDDGNIKVFGYVEDEYGEKASCPIEINKDSSKPNCKLKVTSGKVEVDGKYNGSVTVGFEDNSDAGSNLRGYDITSSNTPTYNGTQEFTISQNGTYTIYGYVIDAAGNANSCSLDVTREDKASAGRAPTCGLQIADGRTGKNGWYRSDVTIKMTNKTSYDGATVVAYGVGTAPGFGNTDTFVVNNDGTTVVKGVIKDSNGQTGACEITIKRDATPPTCSLVILEGTKRSDGVYTSNVKVGWGGRNDNLSGVRYYGVGQVAGNAQNEYIIITENAETTVNGYVEDYAGNGNYCKITFTKR